MGESVINIARDFSRSPAGRYVTDGPNSGERFREQFLVPALNQFAKFKLELDGTRGYGSSFLEEAFGGLVRKRGFTADDLRDRVELVTADPSLRLEILQRYWRAQ